MVDKMLFICYNNEKLILNAMKKYSRYCSADERAEVIKLRAAAVRAMLKFRFGAASVKFFDV